MHFITRRATDPTKIDKSVIKIGPLVFETFEAQNVSNEIRTTFLLSKTSKQNEILDNVLLSNSLTISITLSLT